VFPPILDALIFMRLYRFAAKLIVALLMHSREHNEPKVSCRSFVCVCVCVCSDEPPQVVPHITDAIQEWIQKTALKPTSKDGRTPDVLLRCFSRGSVV
jgi:hypothetical protein